MTNRRTVLPKYIVGLNIKTKLGIKSFSTTKSLSLDPSSYTALAFASTKATISLLNPFFLLTLGLATTLYIQLIRVSPQSAISGNLEHQANLVELAESLDAALYDFISNARILNHRYMNMGYVSGYEELRSLYDSLCQVYTSTSQLYDAFESTYEILNDLDSNDGLEYVNRLVSVRNNITMRSNEILDLMRSIENATLGYEFFTERMPNF